MRLCLKKGPAVIFYFLSGCFFIFAHPHVFMESSLVFQMNEAGLENVEIRWTFDEMFSSMIINDYDANKNERFEPAEVTAIKNGAFNNLRNFNYFLYIKYDNKNYPVKSVLNFNAEITGHRLVYIFTVPVTIPVAADYKELKFGVFDSSYYCQIDYRKKEPVQVKDNPAVKYEYALLDDKENAYWGGQIIPKIIQLKFKKNDA